jgi:hypothetical protein
MSAHELRIREPPVPVPQPGWVLIAVKTAYGPLTVGLDAQPGLVVTT